MVEYEYKKSEVHWVESQSLGGGGIGVLHDHN